MEDKAKCMAREQRECNKEAVKEEEQQEAERCNKEIAWNRNMGVEKRLTMTTWQMTRDRPRRRLAIGLGGMSW